MFFDKTDKIRNSYKIYLEPILAFGCNHQGEKYMQNGDKLLRVLLQSIDIENGCWIFRGRKGVGGYGKIVLNKKEYYTHRLMWELKMNKLSKGSCVCHKCDTPACINPDHLFVGTQADNMKDMKKKGRGCIGDKNGARKYPERLRWKNNHYYRIHPEEKPHGENHKSAKLTQKQVEEIKNASGYQRNIAKLYNISQAQVSNIKTGKEWKDIAMP